MNPAPGERQSARPILLAGPILQPNPCELWPKKSSLSATDMADDESHHLDETMKILQGWR